MYIYNIMLRPYIISILYNVTITHVKEFERFVIIHLRVKTHRYNKYIFGFKKRAKLVIFTEEKYLLLILSKCLV